MGQHFTQWTQRVLAQARRATFLAAVAVVFGAMATAVLVRETLALADGSSTAPMTVPVGVAEVTLAPFADVITVAGTARANESVNVASKVADVIRRVMFDSGDVVEAGQVLVEMSSSEEAAALAEARTTLNEARSRLARVQELADRGFVSGEFTEEASADAQRAAAQMRAIESRLADRLIRAPFAGVVGLRNVSAGERIEAGTVIATLNDISRIKLDFPVPERFLATLQGGQTVQARAAAYPDTVFEGVIASIDNQVDPASRTVTVRAELPNEEEQLVPGMLLSVEVRRNEREQPAIPESALVRTAEQTHVYVLGTADDAETHIALRREVRVGLRAAGRVEILDGLSPGDRVVADGTHRVRDGGAVRLVERGRDANEAHQ